MDVGLRRVKYLVVNGLHCSVSFNSLSEKLLKTCIDAPCFPVIIFCRNVLLIEQLRKIMITRNSEFRKCLSSNSFFEEG